MRIRFRKINDDTHGLEVVFEDGRCEEMQCETRSYLLHDLLHYAVESEARLSCGFWGNLARGKTLADLNDRTGSAMREEGPELAAIEQMVGALHGATKGVAAADLVAGIRRFSESLGAEPPPWLTEELVTAVQERMRRLVGQWKATRYGQAMELDWG